jgi:hypothetical protein
MDGELVPLFALDFTFAFLHTNSHMLLLSALLPALVLFGCPSFTCGIPADSSLTESEAREANELFQIQVDSGPAEIEARDSVGLFQELADYEYGPANMAFEFLDPKSGFALLNSKKNLRSSDLFYSKTIYRIPDGATKETVRANLPSILRFDNVQIGLNVDHLAILKEEYPSLRHLIVRTICQLPDRLKTFMESLSAYTNLTELTIDFPHNYSYSIDITRINITGLASTFYAKVPARISFGASIVSLEAKLSAIKQFESIEIGLNQYHLNFLKDEYPGLRNLIV